MTENGGPYGPDLAHIHDDGFGMIARGAAATLTAALAERDLVGGTVVELACGSGISSRVSADAGYEVIGFDISTAMIDLARRRVPEGRFEVRSLYDVEIPPCSAVTAIGEAFNYLFDPRASFTAMTAVFAAAHDALVAGGLLLFDIAQPGRALPRAEYTVWAGEGWRVSSQTVEDPRRARLERRIVSHREIGAPGASGGERRAEEFHELALYDPEEVFAALRLAGFEPRTLAGYAGEYLFSAGHGGYLATTATKTTTAPLGSGRSRPRVDS